MIHYKVRSVSKKDVEPGMSSVCFVVLLRDDSEDGVDVLFCCAAKRNRL